MQKYGTPVGPSRTTARVLVPVAPLGRSAFTGLTEWKEPFLSFRVSQEKHKKTTGNEKVESLSDVWTRNEIMTLVHVFSFS
jgi:hypothetical protein